MREDAVQDPVRQWVEGFAQGPPFKTTTLEVLWSLYKSLRLLATESSCIDGEVGVTPKLNVEHGAVLPCGPTP